MLWLAALLPLALLAPSTSGQRRGAEFLCQGALTPAPSDQCDQLSLSNARCQSHCERAHGRRAVLDAACLLQPDAVLSRHFGLDVTRCHCCTDDGSAPRDVGGTGLYRPTKIKSPVERALRRLIARNKEAKAGGNGDKSNERAGRPAAPLAVAVYGNGYEPVPDYGACPLVTDARELSCTFEPGRPCGWRVGASANALAWRLAGGRALRLFDARQYDARDRPDGRAIELGVAPGGAALWTDQALFVTCPIDCAAGPITVKLKDWRTPGVIVDVCIKSKSGADECQPLPPDRTRSVGSFVTRDTAGYNTAVLPPSLEQFVILTRVYGLPANFTVVLDDLSVDFEPCPFDKAAKKRLIDESRRRQQLRESQLALRHAETANEPEVALSDEYYEDLGVDLASAESGRRSESAASSEETAGVDYASFTENPPASEESAEEEEPCAARSQKRASLNCFRHCRNTHGRRALTSRCAGGRCVCDSRGGGGRPRTSDRRPRGQDTATTGGDMCVALRGFRMCERGCEERYGVLYHRAFCTAEKECMCVRRRCTQPLCDEQCRSAGGGACDGSACACNKADTAKPAPASAKTSRTKADEELRRRLAVVRPDSNSSFRTAAARPAGVRRQRSSGEGKAADGRSAEGVYAPAVYTVAAEVKCSKGFRGARGCARYCRARFAKDLVESSCDATANCVCVRRPPAASASAAVLAEKRSSRRPPRARFDAAVDGRRETGGSSGSNGIVYGDYGTLCAVDAEVSARCGFEELSTCGWEDVYARHRAATMSLKFLYSGIGNANVTIPGPAEGGVYLGSPLGAGDKAALVFRPSQVKRDAVLAFTVFDGDAGRKFSICIDSLSKCASTPNSRFLPTEQWRTLRAFVPSGAKKIYITVENAGSDFIPVGLDHIRIEAGADDRSDPC